MTPLILTIYYQLNKLFFCLQSIPMGFMDVLDPTDFNCKAGMQTNVWSKKREVIEALAPWKISRNLHSHQTLPSPAHP